MTVAQLLEPRFEVIAPIPFHYLPAVGKIIDFSKEKRWKADLGNHFITEEIHKDDIIADCRKATANFRELGWWENRDKEDMPEYIRVAPRIVVKVKRHFTATGDKTDKMKFSAYNTNSVYPYRLTTPATQEEYELAQIDGDKIASHLSNKHKGAYAFWHVETTDVHIKLGYQLQNAKNKMSDKALELAIKRENRTVASKVHITSLGTVIITKKTPKGATSKK